MREKKVYGAFRSDGPDPQEERRAREIAEGRRPERPAPAMYNDERDRQRGTYRDDRRDDRRYRDEYDRRRRYESRNTITAELLRNVSGLRPYSNKYGDGYDYRDGNYYDRDRVYDTEQELTTKAYLSADRIVDQFTVSIFNRTGTLGKAIDDAMEKFKYPCKMRHPDPVFSQFINDLRGNGGIYITNVATYISMTLVHCFAHSFLRYGKEPSPQEVCDRIINATLRLLVLEFGNWILTSEDGYNAYYHLSPQARSKLDERDNIIDNVISLMNDIATGTGSINNANVPWEKDLVTQMHRNAPSTSPTFDSYLRERDYHLADDNYLGSTVRTPDASTYVSRPAHSSDDWCESSYQAYLDLLPALSGTVASDFRNSRKSSPDPAFNFNCNWSDKEAVSEEKESIDDFVTLDNFSKYSRSEVNHLKWFIPVPGMTDTYVIRPEDFNTLSLRLTNVGNNKDYCDGVQYLANTMPVVKLDWEAGKYEYKLIHVNNEKEIEMYLTNPEKVLRKLETRSEEQVFAEYKANAATLEEIEAQRALAKNDPNAVREMKNAPQIIFASKPYTSNYRQGLSTMVDALNTAAEKKCGKEVAAVALPFTDCAEFEVPNISIKEIRALFPYLVTGEEFNFSLKELLMEINTTIDNQLTVSEFKDDWKYIQYYLNRHISTVINRWLVEERYYGPTRKDKNFLAISGALQYGEALLDEIYKVDVPSYRILNELFRSRELVEKLQLFASEEELAEFANIGVDANIEESMRDEYKENIMNKAVVATASGVLVCINKATPLEPNKPRVLERSSNPEILSILDEAPSKVVKHFKRRVPVFLTFGKDMAKTVWTVTYSGESPDKVMLVPVRSDQSLAFRRTLISEITYTRPGEEGL